MSWHTIKLIFLRELRDQLRDRRTLFMIAILPILLYPLLGIGMVQMTLLFAEQPRKVVVLNTKDLPAENDLLLFQTKDGKTQFNPNWFQLPQDIEKLSVLTEEDAEPGTASADTIHYARRVRDELGDRVKLDKQLEGLEKQNPRPDAEIEKVSEKIAKLNARLSVLFKGTDIDVLLIVPEDFDANVRKADDRIRKSTAPNAAIDVGDYPGVMLIFNRADEKSTLANRRVERAIERWEEKLRQRRFSDSTLHERIATPANLRTLDIAEDKAVAANVWSKLFPALLIIMSVTGAFYPAIDLAAGEKERGTMETLLICPARRSEIVMGKFLTVFAFSSITALLNLISLGLTGKYISSMGGGMALRKLGDLSMPGIGELMWVVVLLLPLAALFSALCFALATFARSTKEGQYYLTPLLMVTMGLMIFCLSPLAEMQPFYSVLPVIGPGLMLREVLSTGATAATLTYAFPVLAASIAWSWLAIWWAIEQFGREEVLFREAERIELKLMMRHMLREKEPVPSGGQAGLCVVLILILSFGMMKFAQGAIEGVDKDQIAVEQMKISIINQLVVIACPALFMGLLLTTNWRGTFRLKNPKTAFLALGIALPFVLHPLEVMLQDSLRWFFPPLPAGVEQAFGSLGTNVSMWLVVLAVAIMPGICEEVAFRGFILKGLERNRKPALAIVLSALAFGLVHMIPQQVFNATLVGLILGLLAVRSGSLWPCIAFHIVHNTIAIWHSWLGTDWNAGGADGFVSMFVTRSDRGTLYDWPTLILAAAVATYGVRWLYRTKYNQSHSQAVPAPVGTAELKPES